MSELFILIIPLIGTVTGASAVFFIKRKTTEKTEKMLLGFASGVMIAAAVWSLIIPSIEMAESQEKIAWIPAATGFICGILFLLVSDIIISRIKPDNKKGFSKTAMLIFAVTLHNIPEGMAVGVAYAGTLAKNTGITYAATMALSLGIAIQNIPEGAIISMPLISKTTKPKAFLYGFLSGIVEPIAGFLTVIFVSRVTVLLPYLLSFAAGAMFYVVMEELIPEAHIGEHCYSGIIASSLGFMLMMILDVAFG